MNKEELKWISVKDSLPEVTRVDSECSESKSLVVLVKGTWTSTASFNKGIENGEYWSAWFGEDGESIDVTHWCDCIPELPKE